MTTPIIAPSVLAADFANLQRDIEMVNQSEADLIHIDIMDGTFVPNISFGFPVCAAINRHAKKPLDYHLMIEHPEKYLQQCKDNGAATIAVHHEACPHLHSVIQEIKKLNCKASVAINPHTPVEQLRDVIAELDVVLIMSVNPGFGGQVFLDHTYEKIRALKALINQTNADTLIEIDGGVTDKNARMILDAGADILVAGSFVFRSEDPVSTISELKAL